MTEQTQGTATDPAAIKMPHTWEEALKMWDAGEPVPAFRVESEGATQEHLWGVAFDELRGDIPWTPVVFTERERHVVNRIVQVAKLVSWPQMISRNVHAISPPLMIRKSVEKRD